MNKLKKYTSITLFLLLISCLALFFSLLALTDIYHGETDLHGEWMIVRITAIIFLAFITSTAVTIMQAFDITSSKNPIN